MRALGLLSVSMLHIVAYFSFIVLGIPDGMLGVAWPSMSTEFSQPLGALGILLLGFTAGYLATTTAVGLVLERLGYRRHLTVAGILMTSGAAGIAFAFGWILVVAAAAVLGAGAGMLDGGLNTYAAQHFRPRDLNWLHAAYGVGATVGPLLMTPIVASSLSWRVGYIVFGLCAAAMMVSFAVYRGFWGTEDERQEDPGREEPADVADPAGPTEPSGSTGTAGAASGSISVILGSLLVFFLYTGLEVVAGQWSFTLFTVGRGIEASRAGPWVSTYWAALTAGRVAFGWISERFASDTLLRSNSALAGFGILLLWVGQPAFLGAVGLAILGFSLAPMFPLLIGLTPTRAGSQRSLHVVGLQIAASNIGAVSLVGLVGLLVEWVGLELIAPALFANAILFALANELVARRSRAQAS